MPRVTPSEIDPALRTSRRRTASCPSFSAPPHTQPPCRTRRLKAPERLALVSSRDPPGSRRVTAEGRNLELRVCTPRGPHSPRVTDTLSSHQLPVRLLFPPVLLLLLAITRFPAPPPQGPHAGALARLPLLPATGLVRDVSSGNVLRLPGSLAQCWGRMEGRRRQLQG